VNALDLVILGRRLTKIGEEAMRGSGRLAMPTGSQLVLTDVFRNPGSSIKEITARTGLRQSHVSVAVAHLRGLGVLDTAPDPHDRRRTLVTVDASHPRRLVRAGAVSVDGALADALGEEDLEAIGAITAQLEHLARRLAPETPGPIVRAIEDARRAERE
jgi:DNA-binding MarR family transcriptional regulator